MSDPVLADKKELLETRKTWLKRIADNLDLIEHEDSLQRIAAMPETERRSFVKNIVRDLRRKQGLKDEPLTTGSIAGMPANVPSLFDNGNSGKGEWYFYNGASKQKGQADFKARWGNRPNIDNWRRGAAIGALVQTKNNAKSPVTSPGDKPLALTPPTNQPQEITFDALYGNLPLTPEAKQSSDSLISLALFDAGKTFIQDAEDCNEGVADLERLRLLTPGFEKMNEVYFNLYYCYTKNGETAKADAIKKLMNEKYTDDRFTKIVTTGKDPQANTANNEATKTYEQIYDLFIEGRFEDAIAQKKIADSIYGKNYWTPQLLFIEAVYYTKQRDDSTAIKVLNEIVGKFPNTPMANKATNLINVLGRRKEIEDELTRLNIERPVEQPRPILQQDTTRLVKIPDRVLIDTTSKNIPPQAVTNKPAVDSANIKTVTLPKAPTAFALDTNAAHYVVRVLNKVDPVFCNEAKNAFFRYNREVYYNKQIAAELTDYDADNKLLLMSPFINANEAIEYVSRAKPKAATEIIPWLRGGKYEFIIISENNLRIVNTNKNLTDYKTFINAKFPGKF
jgi:hypothetical protein